MTVQEVSRLSGLSEPTLYYYEKIGLINSMDRDESISAAMVDRAESSGHRPYSAAWWTGSAPD